MINKSLKTIMHGALKDGLNLDRLRKDNFPEPGPLARRKCRVETLEINGSAATWLYPRHAPAEGTILYFHGGSYVSGPSLLHWRMLSHICRTIKYRILLVDYPKAPEHPFPEGMETMEEAYRELLDETPPEEIIFMGDSAGGGLTLGMAMKLRDLKKPLPGKLVLLSPWLSVLMDNEGIENQLELDNMLAPKGLIEAGVMYGGEDLKNPYISPLFGDLTGLPPMMMQIGTLDLLLPDCRDFRKKAESTGASLNYEEWEGMFHTWMLNTPYLPEANKAVDSILDWITG